MVTYSYESWKREQAAEVESKQTDLEKFLRPDPVKQLQRLTEKKRHARLADEALEALRDRAVVALGRAAGLNRRQRGELAERVQRDLDALLAEQAAKATVKAPTERVLRSSGWLGDEASKPSAGRSSALRTLKSTRDSVVTPIPHGARGAASWESYVTTDAHGQEWLLGARLIRSAHRRI